MCRLAGIVGHRSVAEGFIERMRVVAQVNPHGNGLGGFVDGAPKVHRSPLSAEHDPGFSLDGFPDVLTVVAHDRFATMGRPTAANSHPFPIGNDMLFAQNGTFRELDALEAHFGLQAAGYRLIGDTDSERYGAALHLLRERNGGDLTAAYAELVPYLAERHPMTSINSVVTDRSGDLWALRYPENRTLYVRRLGARDAEHGHRLLGGDGRPVGVQDARGAATVVASQPLDESGAWELLRPGELLHVRASDLAETRTTVWEHGPRRRLPDSDVDLGVRQWQWAEPEDWAHSEFPHDPAGQRAAVARYGAVPDSEAIATGTAPPALERIAAKRQRAAAEASSAA